MKYDIIIIGAGPAGLAAAVGADKEHSVLILEREGRAGGILKQCIHDGFGLLRYKEKLTGNEYAERDLAKAEEAENIFFSLKSFVTSIKKEENHFVVEFSTKKGMKRAFCQKLIFTTGCRERTAKQIAIHGTRPAGVITAGAAQHFVNLSGYLPGKRVVILGSGDIGLIMARRLTLEGAKVIGVYEAKSTPSGLRRNIKQCLEDFYIPLTLNQTVSRVFGEERLEKVEIVQTDSKGRMVEGTEEIVDCDTLILSVGLIPENELIEKLNIEIDPRTKGPKVDQHMMTSEKGVYCAGNALFVHDLVDYVSEGAGIAGRMASRAIEEEKEQNRESSKKNEEKNKEKECCNKTVTSNVSREKEVLQNSSVLVFVPQKVIISEENEKISAYFRASKEMRAAQLTIRMGEKVIVKKKYSRLSPTEMEKINFDSRELIGEGNITVEIEEAEK